MSLEPALSLEETAAACGRSAERFRRVWGDWVRQYRFPQPFQRPHNGRGKYAWRAASVEAWIRAREGALGVGPPPDPANDALLRAPAFAGTPARVHRQRLELAARMKGLG